MKTIITFTGPSGAGKDTLINALQVISGCMDAPEDCAKPESLFGAISLKQPFKTKYLVSHSTRKIRDGEIEGRPYYFVNQEEFMKYTMLEITEYAGNLYGLSVSEVKSLPTNTIGLIAVDQSGVRQIRANLPQDVKHISVFLKIDAQLSMARMLWRGDAVDSVATRMCQQTQKGEYLDRKFHYDYVFDMNSPGDLAFAVLTLANHLADKENVV